MVENDRVGQLIPILLMGQLGGAHRSDFWVRDAGELRGWLVAAANKSQLIYGSTGRDGMHCIGRCDRKAVRIYWQTTRERSTINMEKVGTINSRIGR